MLHLAQYPVPAHPASGALLQATSAAGAGQTHSISITDKFYCRPRDLYEALTGQGRVRAYTQVGLRKAQDSRYKHLELVLAKCQPVLTDQRAMTQGKCRLAA